MDDEIDETTVLGHVIPHAEWQMTLKVGPTVYRIEVLRLALSRECAVIPEPAPGIRGWTESFK